MVTRRWKEEIVLENLDGEWQFADEIAEGTELSPLEVAWNIRERLDSVVEVRYVRRMYSRGNSGVVKAYRMVNGSKISKY